MFERIILEKRDKKSFKTCQYNLYQLLINQTFLVDVSDQLLLVFVKVGHIRHPDVHLLHQLVVTKTIRRGIVQLLSWLGDVGKSLPILI